MNLQNLRRKFNKGLFIMFENSWWLHLRISGLDVEMLRGAGRDEPLELIKENV
jgi:hypothetical protein